VLNRAFVLPSSRYWTIALPTTATNCRLKRHLIATLTLKHGSQAETKPDRTIHTHSLSFQRTTLKISNFVQKFVERQELILLTEIL
jgi:hypothetical protein